MRTLSHVKGLLGGSEVDYSDAADVVDDDDGDLNGRIWGRTGQS